MSLNIKNPEAHRLAQQLADLTGETLTAAVTEALRERLARVRGATTPPMADLILSIGRDCAQHLREPFLSADHADLLYGEDGLPH